MYRWQPLPRSFAFGGSEADNTLMAGSSAACSPHGTDNEVQSMAMVVDIVNVMDMAVR